MESFKYILTYSYNNNKIETIKKMPVVRRSKTEQQEVLDDGAEKKPVQLKDLFNYGRWKRPFTLKHLLFALYLPFGLILLWPLRFIVNLMYFSSSLFLPKSVISKLKFLLYFTMGLNVSFKGLENVPEKTVTKDTARILVCNHLTDFDPYPVFLIIQDVHCLVAAHIEKVPIVGTVYKKVMNTIFVDATQKDKVKDDVRASLSKSSLPLLIYPEGGLTSGKTGMMMFQKFVFGLNLPIVPMAMKMSNPWPVEIDYLGSSWFKNFFWWMLIPYHNIELEFLPKVSIRPGEQDFEFASRVQTLIANHLGIEPTSYPYAQKKELAKQLFSKN
ncbi:hypothetical protein CYY_004383 [Polysphondylium violaceum]|uniref:Phospholipid/glycerol acyltransferase domain-containing protein n=1 Tax=Polysphondylium violaceum TaxID=133409 RepID=A0A8J4V0D9_9MYCE|nr:hypothetical protein CYY_004383 [Polysphondylium violaceum]